MITCIETYQNCDGDFDNTRILEGVLKCHSLVFALPARDCSD